MEIYSEDDGVEFPGTLEVIWRRLVSYSSSRSLFDTLCRALSDEGIPRSKTILAIPNLYPPREELIALIHCPPAAQLHQAFSLDLTVQNQHPSRTADVYLDVDSSEAFVLAGPRHARLTTLLPGTSEQISYKLMPLLTGSVRLPVFRLYDRRKPLGLTGSAATMDGDGGADGTTSADGAGNGRPIQVLVVGQDAAVSLSSAETLANSSDLYVHTIFVYPY